MDKPKRIEKSRDNKVIDGVCAGLGAYFGIDPTIVRLLFIVVAMIDGIGVVVYIILMIIMPEEPKAISTEESIEKQDETVVKDEEKDIEKDKEITKPVEQEEKINFKMLGVIIAGLGIYMLLVNFGIKEFFNFGIFSFSKLWPIGIIIVGIILLVKKSNEKK